MKDKYIPDVPGQGRLILKVLQNPIIRIVIGLVTCLAIPYLFKEFISVPILEKVISNTDVVKLIQHSISITLLFSAYIIFSKFYERRAVTELSLRHMPKEMLVGFLMGIGLISLVILVLFLLGYYKVLEFVSLYVFTVPLLSLLLMAIMEEILFRGIIYRILEQWLGTKIALLIPSLIFGIAHITNENSTIIGMIGAVIGGLLVSISYTYSKRLWLPISLHLGWNFGQIIFGSNLSGMDEFGKMFRASIEGPKFLVGTAFGVEDSILSLIFTLTLFLLILYKSIKNGLIVNTSWKS